MTIATLADLKAGLQAPMIFIKQPAANAANAGAAQLSCWGVSAGGSMSSWPAGVFNTTLAGVVLTSPTTGQMPLPDPGASGAYLARSAIHFASSVGIIAIADRIWHNGGISITSTSAQAIGSPTFPARDDNDSSNGDGYLAALEVSATVGAASQVTLDYTNSAGTAGRSSILVGNAPATGSAQRMIMFGLQSGDVGIRSIQNVTLTSSWVSGTINLVVFRPLAFMNGPALANQVFVNDAINMCMPRIKVGTVPYIFGFTAIVSSGFVGQFGGELVMSHG